MQRNPFKHHRFPPEVILCAVRWYCRYALSCRDVRDLLVERGIDVDASTNHRGSAISAQKSRNGRSNTDLGAA